MCIVYYVWWYLGSTDDGGERAFRDIHGALEVDNDGEEEWDVRVGDKVLRGCSVLYVASSVYGVDTWR